MRDGMIEATHKRDNPQAGRPHNVSYWVVELVPERQHPQGGRPRYCGDGLVKHLVENELAQ